MAIDYKQTQFLLSAAKLEQLPPDHGIEVAFAGRSNAGKSTTLNVLTQQRNLARTSKTPGRTQLINLFSIDDDRRLVDLPGYGYAKVPLEVKNRWQQTLSRYLETRQCLRGLILLMDIRHPLTPYDENMLLWASTRALSVHVLLTKADKLSRGGAQKVLHQVNRELEAYQAETSCQVFSGLNATGLDKLRAKLGEWFATSS